MYPFEFCQRGCEGKRVKPFSTWTVIHQSPETWKFREEAVKQRQKPSAYTKSCDRFSMQLSDGVWWSDRRPVNFLHCRRFNW